MFVLPSIIVAYILSIPVLWLILHKIMATNLSSG